MSPREALRTWRLTDEQDRKDIQELYHLLMDRIPLSREYAEKQKILTQFVATSPPEKIAELISAMLRQLADYEAKQNGFIIE